METRNKRTKVVVSILALATLCVFSLLAVAGNLEPSAPPAPTMKTLDEVEPRVPIHASDLPLIITEPNSYYLAENIHFTEPNITGIRIEANDVTIDLMGFSLIGPGKTVGSVGHGIYASWEYDDITVLKGTVANWREKGIALWGDNNQVRHVKAVENGASGICADHVSIVSGCTSYSNGGDGFYVGDGSTVSSCTAYGNKFDGIEVHEGSTVCDCSAYNNGSDGFYIWDRSIVSRCSAYDNGGHGFKIGNSCVVSDCTASKSYADGFHQSIGGAIITGCIAQLNGGDGIDVTEFCTVSGCKVDANTGDGIKVGGACRVVGNHCGASGYPDPNMAGIHILGELNHIEGNMVIYNGRGIDIDDVNNIIIRNTASYNTITNYDIVPGNSYGQIIDVSGVGSFANTDPTANFEF